jgi:signal transduction histidine kinase
VSVAPRLTAFPNAARRNRAIYLVGYLIYGVVAIRELTFLLGEWNLAPAAALLGAILLLMATDPLLFRRYPWYRYLYFPVQAGLIQALGLLRPYQDIWGILYIFIGVQAFYYFSLPAMLAWGGFFAASTILTLMFTQGWAAGLGFGLSYVAGGVLVVSYEVLYSQAETARQGSQALLAELQQAHQRLQAYAAQVEAHAAAQERDRMAHDLHDSVSQTLFGITLTAQAACLLLDKDPARVPEQLERLQEMTGSALSQMRWLITQWRPK